MWINLINSWEYVVHQLMLQFVWFCESSMHLTKSKLFCFPSKTLLLCNLLGLVSKHSKFVIDFCLPFFLSTSIRPIQLQFYCIFSHSIVHQKKPHSSLCYLIANEKQLRLLKWIFHCYPFSVFFNTVLFDYWIENLLYIRKGFPLTI